MYFLILLMILGTVLLGYYFIQSLIGGKSPLGGEEAFSVRFGGKELPRELFTLGIALSILGALWLCAWFFFLFTGWESFRSQGSALLFHVVLQFVTSMALLLAGLATLVQWNSWRKLYVASMAILIASVQVGILLHGPRGHGPPLFMYLFAIWTLVVGGAFTMALYILDRVLHGWDRTIPGGAAGKAR